MADIFISDLPQYSGVVSNSNYVAVDDGTTTKKATVNQISGITFDTITQTDVAVAGSASTDATIPIAKTGYTARGIVGVRKSGAGQGSAVISNFYLSANASSAIVSVYNISATDRTLTVMVTIIYERNS